MTAYYELPLTSFERAQIVNSVLLPWWSRAFPLYPVPAEAVGPDGVPHRLLGLLPDEHLRMLYDGVLAVWKTGDIPTRWLHSEVVLMYKKGDPDRPENYRPIYI